jgi:hypothetical protein
VSFLEDGEAALFADKMAAPDQVLRPGYAEHHVLRAVNVNAMKAALLELRDAALAPAPEPEVAPELVASWALEQSMPTPEAESVLQPDDVMLDSRAGETTAELWGYECKQSGVYAWEVCLFPAAEQTGWTEAYLVSDFVEDGWAYTWLGATMSLAAGVTGWEPVLGRVYVRMTQGTVYTPILYNDAAFTVGVGSSISVKRVGP